MPRGDPVVSPHTCCLSFIHSLFIHPSFVHSLTDVFDKIEGVLGEK